MALRTERHVTWHPAFSPPNQQPTCFLRRHWRPLFHIMISLRPGSRSGSKATRARRPTSGGRNGPDAVRGACGTQCLASSQSLYENASHQKQTSWVLEPPNPGIFMGFHQVTNFVYGSNGSKLLLVYAKTLEIHITPMTWRCWGYKASAWTTILFQVPLTFEFN